MPEDRKHDCLGMFIHKLNPNCVTSAKLGKRLEC